MKNTVGMNTGEMPSVTMVKDAKAGLQHTIMVDPQANATESTSLSRGGKMDLGSTPVNPIKPSNRDTYQ